MSTVSKALGITATLVTLLGMGGIGGIYYQLGQEQQRDEQLREDVRELNAAIGELDGAVEELDGDVGEIRDELLGVARAACEALGHESVLDDCPL